MAGYLINNSLVHKLLYYTLETNDVIVEGSATSMRECWSKCNAVCSFRGSGTCGAPRRGCVDERD